MLGRESGEGVGGGAGVHAALGLMQCNNDDRRFKCNHDECRLEVNGDECRLEVNRDECRLKKRVRSFASTCWRAAITFQPVALYYIHSLVCNNTELPEHAVCTQHQYYAP